MPISYLAPHLLRVIWFYFGKTTYHHGIGKWLMAIMAKLGWSNRIIYPNEKQGRDMKPFPAQLPNALAALVLPQLQNLDKIQSVRQRQVARYTREISNPKFQFSPLLAEYPLVRLPGLVTNPIVWHQAAAQTNIFLGDWYSTVVAPNTSNAISGYQPDSCVQAESLATQSINLPTGPWLTPTEQGRVIAFINSFHP